MIGRGFKGLKQAIKLEFKLGRYDKVDGVTTHFVRCSLIDLIGRGTLQRASHVR